MPAETMIQCDSLTKRFSHFTAVDHVSFSVSKVHIFGFLGPDVAAKIEAVASTVTVVLK